MNPESINLRELTQVGMLLDPLGIRSLLDQYFSLPGGPVTILRARLRPGRNVEVTYGIGANLRFPLSLPVDNEQKILTLLAEIRPPEWKTSSDQNEETPLEIKLGDSPASVWFFPEDRKLSGLSDFIDPSSIQNLIWANSGEREMPDLGLSLIQYVSSRSCTVRAENDDRVLYGKRYVPGVAEAAWRIQKQVYEELSPDVALARPLLVSGDQIWQEELKGTPLDLLDDHGVNGLELAAEAIARFHRCPSGATPDQSPYLSKLDETEAVFQKTVPALSPRVSKLIGSLKAKFPKLSSGFIHGDLHLRNLVYDGERVGMIDLDNAGPGDRASDIGSLVASFFYLELSGQAVAANDKSERFLGAYREAGANAISDESLYWHIAFALLCERAARCITRLKLEPDGIISSLLEVAEDHILRS